MTVDDGLQAAGDELPVASGGQTGDGSGTLTCVIAAPKTHGAKTETLTYWIDESGKMQRRESSFLDQSMDRVTEVAAMAPSDQIDFDLALQASVRLDRPIPDPESVRTARYRIHWTGDPPPLPNCAYQTIIPETVTTAIIEVAESHNPPPAARNPQPTSQDVTSNRWLEVTHPAIQSLAGTAAGVETDPRKTALAIREHVYYWLDKSEADQVLATARASCRRPQG